MTFDNPLIVKECEKITYISPSRGYFLIFFAYNDYNGEKITKVVKIC